MSCRIHGSRPKPRASFPKSVAKPSSIQVLVLVVKFILHSSQGRQYGAVLPFGEPSVGSQVEPWRREMYAKSCESFPVHAWRQQACAPNGP